MVGNLHRDISNKNVMMKKNEDRTFSGILADWDLVVCHQNISFPDLRTHYSLSGMFALAWPSTFDGEFCKSARIIWSDTDSVSLSVSWVCTSISILKFKSWVPMSPYHHLGYQKEEKETLGSHEWAHVLCFLDHLENNWRSKLLGPESLSKFPVTSSCAHDPFQLLWIIQPHGKSDGESHRILT